MEDQNPFQDPAVTQHSSSTGYATLDLYNPFENDNRPPPPYEAAAPPAPTAPAQTPPSRTTPTEPRNYGSYNNSQTAVNATTAELLRKQEELEKKAQDLERRERELQSHSLGPGASRQNNWPPLPSFCPVGPCFYQDINVEISQQFQRIVTFMYYFWMFNTGTMLLNLISSLAMFCIDPSSSGVGLGLAILWAILFTPCSFVCWYRPVYKAFRSDSSFNFFVFFFVFFAQVVTYVVMTIGIPGWGFSGWIVSLTALKANSGVGAIMMINSILFTAEAALGVILLKKVHGMYRQTDASFQKAQAEFATGVMSNQAVRQAAANAATGAATSAAKGAFTAPQ